MLEIGFNGITDVGLARSPPSLGAVPHLVELEAVTWNEATEEAVEEVFAAIERRKMVPILGLRPRSRSWMNAGLCGCR